ncbi:hypothetical protein F441_08609 [Phytophthora nicotianae CJ01A1]|uniref:Uncharacterized protein n=5 Tax=Phytophthora nicotianae TaxID=4792 RepID=W2ZCD1_PHYNI|nr:hypothetical protein L915_08468 [Phytophthora nicotianae]ETO75737.1 hypothetical protein F444_08688 [Phytophthora nicotianae P1976]ETP16872.1 hypothetical protein F441_08609 [Phytophthora nicotianae CJ01A1]ETP44928.1 hypothetical protein F442_08565 [Phytophthora nicotianae P10297]ETL40421.1 hypothetical protein L916_08397 [Phytophthora nicotianae]
MTTNAAVLHRTAPYAALKSSNSHGEPPIEVQTADSAAEGNSSSSDSESEYEILYPGHDGTQEILDNSDFYGKFMPSTDVLSESVLQFCGSFSVRMAPLVATALVRRFTDARFNWATKTLQSFLEMVCWISVTCATYSLYGDLLFALEVGTFVGAMMSVCDEIVLQFVRGLARVIRNQPGGGDLLQRLGFDVPKNGKAPTDGQEITLIKNLVFGYLGVVAVRSLWENYHDVKFFALLTACTGVAFVVTAEFCCLWLPTRRVGLTLQSRFTKVRRNWQDHWLRSLVEILCWTMLTSYLYYSSEDFWWAFQVGTLVAVGVSLSSGLDHLADVDTYQTDKPEYGFWEERALDDPFMALAGRLVKVQHAFEAFGRAVETEAMNMYENFGE